MTTRIPGISEIAAAVEARAGDLVELTQMLVRIPSVTGEEGIAQEAVAGSFEKIGLHVDMWEPDPGELAPFSEHVGEIESLSGRPNVVGTWNGSGDGKSLILNSHIDTVEPGDPETWTVPAFDAAIQKGSIVGRGALDMKGGLATNVIALAALKDLGFAPRGTVHIQSVISEEDGGAGTLAAILRGYTADAAIITEPTDQCLVIAQGGSLVFRIRIRGRSAHAAVRNEGESAFEHFLPIWHAINEFEARRNRTIDHPLYDGYMNKIPINIGIVRSGSWPSSVPEWLIAEGRAGLVPGEDISTFKDEFVSVVLESANSHPWLCDHPPEVEWFSGQFAPAEIDANQPLPATLAAAHRAATGREVDVIGVTYGADMRHFIAFGNTPCVMYGAGNVRSAHHADESIEIASLVSATKVISSMVVNWSG